VIRLVMSPGYFKITVNEAIIKGFLSLEASKL